MCKTLITVRNDLSILGTGMCAKDLSNYTFILHGKCETISRKLKFVYKGTIPLLPKFML